MIFSPLASGKSVENCDIEAFKSEVKGEKYIYLMGGVHGDEVEGVYVLKELFDWLKNYHDCEELPLIVIPILNIDGYRALTRVNSHQVDLNRNYPTDDWSPDFKQDKYNPGSGPLSEPENQFLIKLFQKYSPSFVLTFHSWKPVLNFNGDCKDIADFLSLHNHYPVAGDIGYPTPGSLGTYVPKSYDGSVLTFECPTLHESGKTLKEIWEENEGGLKKLFTDGILKQKLSQ